MDNQTDGDLKYSLSPCYTNIVRNPIISSCIKFSSANSYVDILCVGIDKPAKDKYFKTKGYGERSQITSVVLSKVSLKVLIIAAKH